MGFRDAAKHRMLDHLVGNVASGEAIASVSLHTAFPASDANEIVGGAYARQTPVWTAAGAEAGGRVDHGALSFEIPAGVTVAAVAYRGATTILVDADVPDETFTAAGQYQVTDASYLHLNYLNP